MGKDKENRHQRALQQEPLCDGCLLRCQRGHTSARALHHGSGLAGSLRQEYVHPAHRGRTGDLRAQLCHLQRIEGQGGEL